MTYAAKTFSSVQTLFITGESAGGFGSIASYATIRDFYPDARGVLMDDSGPVIDDADIAVCLQEKMRSTWNINKNLPADCPCNNDAGNLASAWKYMQGRYPQDSFSLISSQSDIVISTFFAYGNNDCHTVLPVGYSKLQAGLDYLAPIVPVYQIPGSKHCHTSDSEFYSRVVDNQALYCARVPDSRKQALSHKRLGILFACCGQPGSLPMDRPVDRPFEGRPRFSFPDRRGHLERVLPQQHSGFRDCVSLVS